MNDALPDYAEMSDEDFMQLSAPEPGSMDPEPEAEDIEDVPTETEAEAEDAGADANDDAASASDSDHTTPHQSEAAADGPEQAGAGEAEAQPAQAPDVAATQTVNFEEAYKQIMAPFKANGREFAPASPEEVIRLMQMGANYTKKMQALQPNLKMMRMLANNDLLDEAKLSHLIDLARKDKGAIQKLLSDGQIDPLDLNPSEANTYRPGNHRVSDQELAFSETLNDVMATPHGQEIVRLVNASWDTASKDAIYREPEVLQILAEQKANGIMDTIFTEIDRQKMLGNLTNVPILQAYKLVGDTLMSQGKLVPNQGSAGQPTPPMGQAQPRILETRAAQPKTPVPNAAAARAASPARTAAKPAAKVFDPFEMSDAEIMALSMPPGSR